MKASNQKNLISLTTLTSLISLISWAFTVILLMSLQFFSSAVYALQAKTIKDNGTAYAAISTKGMTRIAVDNDRIIDFRGPHGIYTLENDNQQGSVYLRLIPLLTDAGNTENTENTENNQENIIKKAKDVVPKPFSVFIATEQNHNYVLRLTPRNQSADTILLKPVDAVNPEASHWESSSPYTEAITDLMGAMVKGQPPEGYGVEDISSSSKQYLGSIAYARLIRVYSGAHLQGQVYRVTNRTNTPLHFTESEFYKSGDRAVALSSLNVNPQGQVLLYKVISHD